MAERHMKKYISDKKYRIGRTLFDSTVSPLTNLMSAAANKGPIAVVGNTSVGVLCGVMIDWAPVKGTFVRDDFAAIFDGIGAHVPHATHSHDTYQISTQAPTWGGGHTLSFGQIGTCAGAHANACPTSYPTWTAKGTFTVTSLIVYRVALQNWRNIELQSLALSPFWSSEVLDGLKATATETDSSSFLLDETLFDETSTPTGVVRKFCVEASKLKDSSALLKEHLKSCRLLLMSLTVDGDVNGGRVADIAGACTAAGCGALQVFVREESDVEVAVNVAKICPALSHVSIFSSNVLVASTAVAKLLSMPTVSFVSFNKPPQFGFEHINVTSQKKTSVAVTVSEACPAIVANNPQRPPPKLPPLQPDETVVPAGSVKLKIHSGRCIIVQRDKLVAKSLVAQDQLEHDDGPSELDLSGCCPELQHQGVQLCVHFCEHVSGSRAQAQDFQPRAASCTVEECDWLLGVLVLLSRDSVRIHFENFKMQHVLGSLVQAAAFLQMPQLVHLVYSFEVLLAAGFE